MLKKLQGKHDEKLVAPQKIKLKKWR